MAPISQPKVISLASTNEIRFWVISFSSIGENNESFASPINWTSCLKKVKCLCHNYLINSSSPCFLLILSSLILHYHLQLNLHQIPACWSENYFGILRVPYTKCMFEPGILKTESRKEQDLGGNLTKLSEKKPGIWILTQHSSSKSELTSVDQELRKDIFFLIKCLGNGFSRQERFLESNWKEAWAEDVFSESLEQEIRVQGAKV